VTGQVVSHSRLLAGAFLILTLTSQVAAQAPPRVRLVATGGTIANLGDRRLTHDELLGSVPQVEQYARASSEQFANVSSGSLTLDQWLRLARRLNQLFEADSGLAGIVVSAGTDTLEELAYFLHLTVRDARPVVLVAAMRAPIAADHDGPANLLAGFRVGASPASRGRGVLVVLNGEIHGARMVTKTDARRLDAFQSPETGPVGVVDSLNIWYHRSRSSAAQRKRHTNRSEFDVAAIRALPRVDVLLTYQGASGDLVRATVDLGAEGLVLATLGAGATSGTQATAVDYATGMGVVVVRSTRTGAGIVRQRQDARTPALAGGDLPPVKARVLLMLALTRTVDPVEIQAMFERY
jgi:L-asparaginase